MKLPEPEDVVFVASRCAENSIPAFLCLHADVLDFGGIPLEGVVDKEEDSSTFDIIAVDESMETGGSVEPVKGGAGDDVGVVNEDVGVVNEVVVDDDSPPVCCTDGVGLKPLFLTFARPDLSSGVGNICGCSGASGGDIRSRFAGGSGRDEQAVGVGGLRPCISVLISSLLTVSLYHLRRVVYHNRNK